MKWIQEAANEKKATERIVNFIATTFNRAQSSSYWLVLTSVYENIRFLSILVLVLCLCVACIIFQLFNRISTSAVWLAMEMEHFSSTFRKFHHHRAKTMSDIEFARFMQFLHRSVLSTSKWNLFVQIEISEKFVVPFSYPFIHSFGSFISVADQKKTDVKMHW